MSLSKKAFKWTSTNLPMRIQAAQIARVAFLVGWKRRGQTMHAADVSSSQGYESQQKWGHRSMTAARHQLTTLSIEIETWLRIGSAS